jgi:hypothetical protein
VIVKIIAHPKHAAVFARVARYVVDAKGGVDPAAWTRTADYVLDTPHAGDRSKVGAVRVTNCLSDDPASATLEILATQAKNTRSQSDKHYHLVISFPPGEKVPVATLHEIEDAVCAAIGLADHQRISAVHLDTDHLHVHVAISKVHPATLRNVEPYYPKHRLMEACERLEVQHGLQRTNHGQAAASRVRGRLADMAAHGGEPSLLQWILDTAGDALKTCSTQGGHWQELHEVLARFDLDIRPRGAGLVIGVRGDTTLRVKASSVDRGLSFKSLTERWGDYVPPASSVEVVHDHPLAEPAERFASRPASVSTLAASGEPEDQPPSSVEGRGASDPRPPATGAPAGAYRPPGPATARTAGLYAAYQRQRDAALQARQMARQQWRDAHEHYLRELKAWYAARRQDIRQRPDLLREARRRAYQELAERRREEFQKHREQAMAQRQAVGGAHPLPTWQEFLQTAALRGDAQALAVLRSRPQGPARLAADLLTATDAETARHVVFEHLRPQILKSGATVYRVDDGGVVADEARQIRVEQLSAGAAFLALSLADERFQGRALIVEGSETFREQVVLHATRHGLDVRFADPAMEAERQRLTAQRGPVEVPPPALAAFLAKRNALRDRVASLPVHQAWTGQAAGEAIYQGRRALNDGSQALLLQRGETMLVKAVSTAEAARASRWPIGKTVRLDGQGRLIDAAMKR